MLFRFQPEDIDMLQSFMDEAIEYLQIIEEEAMKLENSRDVGISIGNIFRNMHTIKGLSSFFGLSPITDLSHQAESMLDAMRKGKLVPDQHVTGLLLEAKDELVGLIKQLGNGCQPSVQQEEVEVVIEYSERGKKLVETLKEITDAQTKRQTVATVDRPEDNPDTSFDIAELVEKASQGMLEDFLLEADEHGSAITDQFLMILDASPHDAATLAEVFRRVHTLKGNISLLLSVKINADLRNVLEILLEAFQELETLLAKTRDDKLPVSSTVTNLCFAAMDAMLRVTTMIRAGSIMQDYEFLVQLVKDVKSARQIMAGNSEEVLLAEPILHLTNGCKPTKNLPEITVVGSGSEQLKAAKEPPNNLGGRPVFSAASNTIRVNGEKLDRLMNVIGELSITKNIFTRMARKLIIEYNMPQMAREIKEAGQFISRISEELEDAIMSMRMTEMRTVFQKFPRIVRDIALQTGKNITVFMEGEETELDKNIVEQISDPLLHIVRNAADHGIESVEERVAAGKDPNGNIYLKAYNRGKSVVIEVEDDGKGMDPEILKNKAVEKGFISSVEAEGLTNEQCYQLIFLPGFSTAREISEISGRGVGMDVVKSNIAALRGSIKIDSELGKGSRITIQLPLTLMVSTGLLVEAADQALIIPIDNVIETLKVPASSFMNRKGKKLLYHRNEVLGVVSLAAILGMPVVEQEVVPTVIISNGTDKIGITVDRLLSEQDILVKALPEYLSNLPAMGGATILGDGKVALVLNASELINLAQK